MNVLDRLNAVVDYIERNITEEIDLNHLANIACCSAYNFQRMFAFITEISIVEYIRRRRLTLAAFELQHSNVKIIDLAIMFGYDSPVSFTRAFQALHGITPSEARKSNTALKAFPRMTFQIMIKGVSEMNYRIVKTPPFQVFGLEGLVSTIGDEKYFAHPGAIWNEFNNGQADAKYDQLFTDAGEVKPSFFDAMFTRKDICRIHGLVNYKQIDATTYGYMLWSFVTPESKTDGYQIIDIPASTWAVFPSDPDDDRDVGTIWGELYKRFYGEWLPSSEYEKANSPEFEIYGGTPPKICYELWMPIIRKS